MTYPWLKNFNAKVTRFQNVEEDLSEGNLIKVIINSSFDQSFCTPIPNLSFAFKKKKSYLLLISCSMLSSSPIVDKSSTVSCNTWNFSTLSKF